MMEASKVDNEDADLDQFSAISIGSEFSKSGHKQPQCPIPIVGNFRHQLTLPRLQSKPLTHDPWDTSLLQSLQSLYVPNADNPRQGQGRDAPTSSSRSSHSHIQSWSLTYNCYRYTAPSDSLGYLVYIRGHIPYLHQSRSNACSNRRGTCPIRRQQSNPKLHQSEAN